MGKCRGAGLHQYKEKQIETMFTFVEGNGTFVSLPTGYGKFLLYAVLPLTLDKLRAMIFAYFLFLTVY